MKSQQLSFETKNLTKRFGDLKALDGVSLSAEKGKIFGLLGPNGAGKTTLIRILSTLLVPDSGTAKVAGINVKTNAHQVRKKIGLAGQYAAVDEYQTGYENVYMTGLLYGLKRQEAKKRAIDLIERLGLKDAANKPVRTYSGGMRRRLDLGASLVGRPEILFLDEPTTGLDPKSRMDIWGIVRELVKEGTSILLTTQYLEEADELADEIAVINEGKVIAQGTSAQLKSRLGADVVAIKLVDTANHDIALRLVQEFTTKKAYLDEEAMEISVPVKDGPKALLGMVEKFNLAKVKLDSVSLHRPSLDDVFLDLTGSKAQDKPTLSKRGRK